MGYTVKTIDGELKEYAFDFGGVVALRNFTARTNGNRLIIQSAENANFTILDALVNEVEIDGVIYDNAVDAQNALQELVFNPNPPVILHRNELDAIGNNIIKQVNIPDSVNFTKQGIANFINDSGLEVGANEIVIFKAGTGTGTGTGTTTSPSITSISNLTVDEDTPITPIQIEVAGTTPAISVTGLRGGLTYNPTTKQITGTPTYVGNINVTITATNSAGTTTETFTITVTEQQYTVSITADNIIDHNNTNLGDFGSTISIETATLPLQFTGSITAPAGSIILATLKKDNVVIDEDDNVVITGSTYKASMSLSSLSSGVYDLTLSIIHNGTTRKTTTKTFTIASSLTVNAGVNITTEKTYIPAFSGQITGGVAPYTVLWTKKSGGTANFNAPTNLGTGVTGLEVGTYVFELKVTDANNTVQTDEVSVTIINATPNYTLSMSDVFAENFTAQGDEKKYLGHYDDTLNIQSLGQNVGISGLAKNEDGTAITTQNTYVEVRVKKAGQTLFYNQNITINSNGLWRVDFVGTDFEVGEITVEAILFVDGQQQNTVSNSVILVDYFISPLIKNTFKARGVSKKYGKYTYNDGVNKALEFFLDIKKETSSVPVDDIFVRINLYKDGVRVFDDMVDVTANEVNNGTGSFSISVFDTQAEDDQPVERGVYKIEFEVVDDSTGNATHPADRIPKLIVTDSIIIV